VRQVRQEVRDAEGVVYDQADGVNYVCLLVGWLVGWLVRFTFYLFIHSFILFIYLHCVIMVMPRIPHRLNALKRSPLTGR
jgi:hypothetical protein